MAKADGGATAGSTALTTETVFPPLVVGWRGHDIEHAFTRCMEKISWNHLVYLSFKISRFMKLFVIEPQKILI